MSRNTIRVLSRSSRLALLQVNEVMSKLAAVKYSIKTISTYGDKNKHIPLSSDIEPDFFTKEIDEALLKKEGDIAIHSAKDLPFPLPEYLTVIALTEAFDKKDALISINGCKLTDLPRGARIGTSSLQRKNQILGVRPDLEIVDIRGSIEERTALLDSKQIDALIVAACALKRLNLENRISEILEFPTHYHQGNLAVTAVVDRADMRVLFNSIDIRNNYGQVFLAGAGTGSQEYLTLKTDRCLKKADIIFYDDLIDKKMLSNYSAAKEYVGKRKGWHKYDQNEINEKLYQSALAGKRTVRLKGGDPLIFGRLGEELDYLKKRFIDVEVIPGISAFQVAAAAAQVPLTSRMLSNSITLHTAQYAKNDNKSSNNSKKDTLIYFMGASRLHEVSSQLLSKGFNQETSVALIQSAGSLNEKIVKTSVKKMPGMNLESPVIVIAGDVVRESYQQSKILYTGLNPDNIKMPGRILHYPLIKIVPAKKELSINSYDAVVFTSISAVSIFCRYNTILKSQKIFAIGPYTRNEIEKFGYEVNHMPKIFDSDHLAREIINTGYNRVLYPCSNLSSNNIHKLDNVYKEVIYKTEQLKQPVVDLQEFTGIIFSSSSTVDAFLEIYREIPQHLVLYVYGEYTKNTLNQKGYIYNVQKIPLSKS
ncbi:MAG: uroporphyrinogen-III C-methyltransferase [bacterium]|nr:uroporphyrinogen-III C-methyltransferase [bacterium]